MMKIFAVTRLSMISAPHLPCCSVGSNRSGVDAACTGKPKCVCVCFCLSLAEFQWREAHQFRIPGEQLERARVRRFFNGLSLAYVFRYWRPSNRNVRTEFTRSNTESVLYFPRANLLLFSAWQARLSNTPMLMIPHNPVHDFGGFTCFSCLFHVDLLHTAFSVFLPALAGLAAHLRRVAHLRACEPQATEVGRRRRGRIGRAGSTRVHSLRSRCFARVGREVCFLAERTSPSRVDRKWCQEQGMYSCRGRWCELECGQGVDLSGAAGGLG